MGSTYYVLEGKETKNTSEGKKKKKSCVCLAESRTLALHAFPAFQYSIPTHWANVTHRSAKHVCVWSVMHYCSDYGVILRGLNKGKKKEI